MTCSISLPLPTARLNAGFTVHGDTLLYADIPRVPINELRKLLSRGSGKVVREGERSKTWFRAQCAHYGLPTDGTLAMLRLYLENSLKSFQERMQEKSDRLEKERLALEKKSRRKTEQPTNKVLSGAIRSPTVPTVPTELSKSTSSSSSIESVVKPQAQPKTTRPNLANGRVPLPITIPALVPSSKPMRRGSTVKGVEEIKVKLGTSNTKLQDLSSSSDTDSDAGTSFSTAEPQAAFPPPGLSSPLFHPNPPRNRGRAFELENDVVSGRWALHVTCSTMEPLPAPWRAASSKWLRGDMDVHLSSNKKSLTAEFALFGLDGVIKSQKFEPRGEGVCSWVRFVAQMPITTATKPGDSGLHENCVFGPSHMQYGYLRFYGEGKIKGMLRCNRYGRLEFEGARIGKPRALLAKWSDYVKD